MEKKEFVINITNEQANYLQRLGAEVDSKIFIIDKLFMNHANDLDTQLFDSVPYKHYMKEFEKAYLAWETAKATFEKEYIRPKVQEVTGLNNPNFNWSINDFTSLECVVELI